MPAALLPPMPLFRLDDAGKLTAKLNSPLARLIIQMKGIGIKPGGERLAVLAQTVQ